MSDRRRELERHGARSARSVVVLAAPAVAVAVANGVDDGDRVLGDDAELLERVRVLRVRDRSHVLEDLAGVDGLSPGVGVREGRGGLFFDFFFEGGRG